MINFEVFGGAREFVNYRGPEAIIHGPAETGKTIAALYKLHIAASTYKDASIVICRKTLASTYSTVLQTFINKVLPPGDELAVHGIKPYGGEKPEWYDYHCTGARIWITGLDKSSKILSAEHDVIYFNQCEEATLDNWETLTTRTTGRAGNMPYAQTIGDMNPAYPTFWPYHRPSLKVFYSQHKENPALFDQRTGEITEQGRQTMLRLDALTGLRRVRLRDGRPAMAEGAIYDTWDESVHLIDADKVPYLERFVGAADWGFRHPGVLGVFGLDHDGAMYLVAQIYHTGKQVDWFCERAAELEQEYPIETWVCDPSEPAYIERLGGEAAYNRVRPGINAVQTRLSDRRLFIVRDSLRYPDQALIDAKMPYRVQDEFPGYVWSSTRKEQPVKEKDDGVDMARYATCYIDSVGEKQLVEDSGAW